MLPETNKQAMWGISATEYLDHQDQTLVTLIVTYKERTVYACEYPTLIQALTMSTNLLTRLRDLPINFGEYGGIEGTPLLFRGVPVVIKQYYGWSGMLWIDYQENIALLNKVLKEGDITRGGTIIVDLLSDDIEWVGKKIKVNKKIKVSKNT